MALTIDDLRVGQTVEWENRTGPPLGICLCEITLVSKTSGMVQVRRKANGSLHWAHPKDVYLVGEVVSARGFEAQGAPELPTLPEPLHPISAADVDLPSLSTQGRPQPVLRSTPSGPNLFDRYLEAKAATDLSEPAEGFPEELF